MSTINVIKMNIVEMQWAALKIRIIYILNPYSATITFTFNKLYVIYNALNDDLCFRIIKNDPFKFIKIS